MLEPTLDDYIPMYNRQQQHYMMIQEQPSTSLQQSISHYINPQQSPTNTHLQQIITLFSTTKTVTLQQVLTLLATHNLTQQNRVRVSELLYQIVKSNKRLVIARDQSSKVMETLTEKVLNLSTTLLTLKTILELGKRFIDGLVFKSILGLLGNPKFHPQSHRQEVRFVSYQLIELLTRHPQYLSTPALQSKLVSIIIDSTYEERDPRNIGKMFTLYHWVLRNIDDALVFPYKNSMFSNLEAYYPIDYIGDEDDGITVTIQQLNSDLDDCITLPIFKANCLELLQSKTATPPTHQFLPTLIKYIQNNPDQLSKLQIILKRSIQEQFLEDPESYPLLCECFHLWFKSSVSNPHSISLKNYDFLITILDLCLKVLPSKSGFVIQVIKTLSGLKQVQSIVIRYVVQHLVVNYRLYNSDNLGYLLGLIVVIQNPIRDEELVHLLHLSLIDIFIMEPVHIQILVLKIFMILKKNENKLSSLQPILKQLLYLLKNQKEQSLLRKSVIEFIEEAGDKIIKFETQEYIQSIYEGMDTQSYENIEIMVYYLLIHDPSSLSKILEKQSELTDCIVEEIEFNIMKITPEQKANVLLGLNHETMVDKYVQRIKGIVSKVSVNQEVKDLLLERIKSKESFGNKFIEIFYIILRNIDLEVIQSHPIFNIESTKIRQLNPQSLSNLQSTLGKTLLQSLCQVSSQDYPTLRQYLFETIYPLILKRATHDIEYKYLLFLLLQQTPASLLKENINQIITMIMNQIQSWTPQISSVCLTILNIYFAHIQDEMYDKLVLVSQKLLTHPDNTSTRIVCNICEIFGKIAGASGQIRFKRGILAAVEPLIRHKKRKVRKIAAYTYNKWYFM